MEAEKENYFKKLPENSMFPKKLSLTDEFNNFLETNGFLEWFYSVTIHIHLNDGGYPLLDICFTDPYFQGDYTPQELEKFDELVASDPRDIVEVVMDRRYDELNPRYDKKYTHFDNELADTIGYELASMGIIDAIRSILGVNVMIYSERVRD